MKWLTGGLGAKVVVKMSPLEVSVEEENGLDLAIEYALHGE